ncbi:GerAB/ArcD/ProY family transporter [Paenibacillus sacheonensis]|uniref:Endospore germination permease n=1 Tax=Paenibacillus sacheonensis TaxID=742054 RepID=A0A7X4YU43_9BACL|nr:endospore germination permease [Paenibacillus sacheonensis]MBM7568894.1 spore germination protein KB [Paenibacillus sacheonensis]NBC72596.1 endospore germination permease [Paenibacillus sacheonensis]
MGEIEKGKINPRQFSVLTLLFSLGSSILIVPSALTSIAKQDGWLAAIAGVAGGMLLLLLYHALGSRYPGQSLIQYSETILGRWLGKLAAVLFLGYFFLLSALVLRNVGDFITTIVMPETPIQVVHTLFLLAIVIGVGLGLEVIARSSEIFLPCIVLLIVVLIVFLIPQIQFDRIEPVFETGAKGIIHGSLSVLSIPYLELVVFLMIFPYVNRPNKIRPAFMKGAVLGGLVIVVVTMFCVFVLGWDFTARHTFPSYTLAKKIQVGEFLQRIEVLVAVIWFLTIFYKLAICFYASMLGMAQLFRMRTYRPLIVPSGIILCVLSIVVYPNIVYFRVFAAEIWPFYALTMGFALPGLLLTVSVLKSAFK